MAKVSAVLRSTEEGFVHFCPGCDEMHAIWVNEPHPGGARWSFDGNVDAPTFSPSVNIVGQCHYFVRAGRIEYCGDSKHHLAGQSVPLPAIPDGRWD